LRKVLPYEAYTELNFKIPYGLNGDSYDRYLLRIQEMRISLLIIEQILNKMPKGFIKNNNSELLTNKLDLKISMEYLIQHFKINTSGYSLSSGQHYIGIEAPKGEFGIYLISNKNNILYRCKIRSPGFIHLQSIDYISKNHLIADVVTIIGSFDIVFGEIDR